MLIERRGLYFLFIAVVAIFSLLGVQPSRLTAGQVLGLADEEPVVLPEKGTLDERPFFSTRRHPVIAYDRQSTDVAGQLAQKVEDGIVKLRFDKNSGYLHSVLEALHVPTETQSVVFSKTSFQAHYISPSNPRAIFYSDDVSVAFIRNAPLLEIAAEDPRQGVLFYIVEQRPSDQPRIVRSDSCLSCHESRNSLDVPGMLARSIGVGDGGVTLPQFGNYVSDHRSPFEERWGGWFITGNTGSARHMGNILLSRDGTPLPSSTVQKPLASLNGRFDLAGYPSRYSDVAAVMVLDHQVRMTNLLTRVGWETRVALDQAAKDSKDREAAERVIASDSAELADYMLFVDEASLPGKFESTSGFAKKFAGIGPKDSHGRSLRQLDLQGRLMRYPCSYMIYSAAFDNLPDAARDAVYARLWAILSGKDTAPRYARLSPADRAAVVDILLETKPGLPDYFKPLKK